MGSLELDAYVHRSEEESCELDITK
jgi:hypothetical protein